MWTIFLKLNLFLCIYFWLRWVFVAARGLSLVAASGGYSSLLCAGFSLWWLLLLRSTGSRHTGFSSCGTRASVVVAHGLSSCGSRAYLLRGMWDLPGPGLEPMSPALAGGFLTIVPPGKSLTWIIFKVFLEFVTIFFLYYVLVFWPQGMWDLSSPTSDWTHIPCIGRQNLNHRTARSPCLSVLYIVVCVFYSQTPNLSHPALLSPLVTISFLCLWVCFCFVNRFICIIFFRFHK